jgi:hypothetical protein
MLKAIAQWSYQGTEPTPAPLVTAGAAACSFGAFFAFVGWYDFTGRSGWKGWAIPVLALAAGQGLGFPRWTPRRGIRLALAGAEAVVLIELLMLLAYAAWPVLLLLPGLPIGFAFGHAQGRMVSGGIAGFVGFNLLSIAVLAIYFQDLAPDSMFPAPGVVSLGIWGAGGGALLAFALTRRPHLRSRRVAASVWERR